MFIECHIKIILILFLLSGNCLSLKSQPWIKGQIKIDSTWTPIIYLSKIPTLDNLFHVSKNMIIESAKIDTAGNFKLDIKFLPKEDQIYRIHLSKKGDPPASLIIGGKDENHLFLITNNHSEITVQDTSSFYLLSDAVVSGYRPNAWLKGINDLVQFADTVRFNEFPLKQELMKRATEEKLRLIADTCSSPLIALYAIYKSNFEKNLSHNPVYYQKFLKKWDKERSAYFEEFRSKIPDTTIQKTKSTFLISILSFLSGGIFVFLIFYIIGKRKSDRNFLRDLTVQERKILMMIQGGKSNKEISDELNIGISTVKSHVNSIYSKLNIKSRKEAYNISNTQSENQP